MAEAQAVSSDVWTFKRPEAINEATADVDGWDLKLADDGPWSRKCGNVLKRYWSKSGLVSNTSTVTFSRDRCNAAIDIPMVPNPIKVILCGSVTDIVLGVIPKLLILCCFSSIRCANYTRQWYKVSPDVVRTGRALAIL